MDDATRDVLRQYLTDLRSLPNESAKTHRFASLISELFPGSKAATEWATGIEKMVRIDSAEKPKRGHIDAYYGNAVIEFERSLARTEETAKRQLREYVSGLRQEGDFRPLICIASDGIAWKIFRPKVLTDNRRPSRRVAAPPARISPDDIELVPVREFTLSQDTLDDFWIWITNLLFRDARTKPTAERFRIDFGAGSLAFSDALEALRDAWKASREEPEAALAFDTWKRYLTLTYGSLTGKAGSRPELETLFLKHTYLASIARFLVWAALSRGKTSGTLSAVADEVLSGLYFRSEGIENLVEDDFFHWVRDSAAKPIVGPVWERSLAQMLAYDLTDIDQDVLKGVYQELVDPKDRHDLGEYYTPEWLCERVVRELLPSEGFVSVIDPTCGSGSFLRAAIAHLLAANPSGGPATRLRLVLEKVVGIDIHPLAVTISRATYTLALGSLVKATKRPIQIPVYMADSLFLPTEVKQLELGEPPAYEVMFGGQKVRLAEELVHSADLFDPAIAACYKVALDHAEGGEESEESLRAFLSHHAPKLAERKDFGDISKGLWGFTKALAHLIVTKRNSIWAFIVRNGYRPAMLKRRFDFVIGNPPWLSYRFISDPDYQAEVKRRAVGEYRIAPKSQKLVTQMELGTVFLVHALKVFGRDNARMGFVMPRSILTADQHSQLRERKYRAPVTIEAYWDLWGVTPVFNVPSCVVLAERREPRRGRTTYEIPVLEWRGRLPQRDISWSEARERLHADPRTGRLIWLGSRSALSTIEGQLKPTGSSPYSNRFRQGATIVPRNLYFIQARDFDPEEGVEGDKLYWAETEPEQAKRAKAPYKDVQMEGPIPGRFLFLTALSENLLPFALIDPKLVVLPLEWDGRKLEVRTAMYLKADGQREMADWMREAERIWKDKRGRKAKKQTVYAWLDYQGKLTSQKLSQRHLVLYNAAGTNLSASRVDRSELPLPFVVESKLYWAACETVSEADFLVAILNSRAVNEAIKPFQSTGLMGERDIHTKVLDLPIPSYMGDDPKHEVLAELGARGRVQAKAFLARGKLPSRLADRRSRVREALADTLDEIDDAVRKMIFPGAG